MNSYLETIDEAIAQVHSRFYGHGYYPAEDYNRDLQGLIELRSFVEGVLEPEECEHCLGQGERWPVDEEVWRCPKCDTEYHSE